MIGCTILASFLISSYLLICTNPELHEAQVLRILLLVCAGILQIIAHAKESNLQDRVKSLENKLRNGEDF